MSTETDTDTETLTVSQRLEQFIDLGANVQLSVHHVSPGALFDLMQDGQLHELKREVRTQYTDDSAPYLVGKAKVNDIEIVLFSSDLTF